MTQQLLATLAALPRPDLRTIFEADKGRLERMTQTVGPLRFDWSKTHLTEPMLAAFSALASAQDFAQKREQLFSGPRSTPPRDARRSIARSGAKERQTVLPPPRRCTIACAR